jgi:hypothetical protein
VFPGLPPHLPRTPSDPIQPPDCRATPLPACEANDLDTVVVPVTTLRPVLAPEPASPSAPKCERQLSPQSYVADIAPSDARNPSPMSIDPLRATVEPSTSGSTAPGDKMNRRQKRKARKEKPPSETVGSKEDNDATPVEAEIDNKMLDQFKKELQGFKTPSVSDIYV